MQLGVSETFSGARAFRLPFRAIRTARRQAADPLIALAVARVAAVLIAATMEVARGPSPVRAAIAIAAVAHAAGRAYHREPTPIVAWIDVIITAALVGFTGGPVSNYAPYGLVTALGVGMALGTPLGAVGGALVVAGSTPIVAAHVRAGGASIYEAGTWLALFPIVGLAGGLGARISHLDRPDNARVLNEANRVLSSLYRLARAMPVGLEIGSVASDALQELREGMRAPEAALLVLDDEVLSVAGSFGIPHPERLAGRGLLPLMRSGARVIERTLQDPLTSAALGPHHCWMVVPVRRGEETLGMVLAACSEHQEHQRSLAFLAGVAARASVAVDNALLFRRVRDLSLDEERNRIARELHDGVAQALTHLRFELGFMAGAQGMSPDQVRGEVARLSKVAERALCDVRATVTGLRTDPSGGIVASLRAYLAEMRGLGGPIIALEGARDVHLPPAVEPEVFRIAQEAVSNALKHSRARRVVVNLESGERTVRMTVEDDGNGIPAARRAGVGLAAMRERAERIGARLAIGDRPGGGTRVALECNTDGRGA